MWNLELEFSEDESIHDGFCISTLLKICAEGSVIKSQKVQAVVENKTIALSIDKSLFILENDDISYAKNISFDSQIDALSISSSGDIIICALSNGHIHGVFVRGYPVFDLKIEGNIDTETKIIGIDRDDVNNFKIFCSNGVLYSLSNIDESQLYSSKMAGVTIEDNVTFDEVLLENVQLEKLPNILSLNAITFYCYLKSYLNFNVKNENYMLISGNSNFIKFQDETFTTKMFLQEEYGSVKNIYNLNSYIIALTMNGALLEICPFTRTVCGCFTNDLDYMVSDIVVMEATNESIELLVLCKSKRSEAISMKIVEFPSFNVLNEISVSNCTWLVSQPKGAVNLYYLSGGNLNNQHLPQEIEIKLIKETQPEERLKKLIHKGHLQEAEEFGKQFNLSLQPIYKAKVHKYLMEINSLTENNLELLETTFSDILRTLKLVEDNEFFHEISLVQIPSRKLLAMYLETILTILDEQNYFEDILVIKEQQLRLKTLDIIDPYECNRDWQKFVQHPNIIKVCVSLFPTDISTACIIWKRHSASIIPNLDDNALKNILNLIPTTIEAFSTVQWLRCFIPSVIQNFPSSMPYVVNWSIMKTRSLQFSNSWPAIGLEFTKKVLDIFESVNFLHSDIRRQYDASMENLRNLTNALEELLILKESFNLVLTLDSYEKNSMNLTTLRILERVQTTMLTNLVNDFLYPIYREKGETPIDAIIKHIRFLIASRNGFTTWIERAVILIDLLHNEEEKLNSALLVLKSAPVPWPEAVKPLIELRNSSHALATEINTICEMQIIETIKIKYNWATNTTDSNIKLLYKMVQINHSDMLEDIKNLLQADPSLEITGNFYCCFELARQNHIERAIEYLNFLDKPQRKTCSEKIINIVSDILEENEDRLNENENKCMFELMKSVSNFVSDEERKLIKIMENVLLLRNKFCINVQLRDLLNENKRKIILTEGISYIITKIDKKIQTEKLQINLLNLLWNDVSELTNALLFSKLDGLILISKIIENVNLSCGLAFKALELIESTPENANLFIEFGVLIIFQQLIADQQQINEIEDPLSYPMVFELMKKALLHRKVYEIEKLLKWIQIGVDLYGINAIKNTYPLNNDINEIMIRHFNSVQNQSNIKNCKSSKKRESFSIFDIPSEKNSSPILKSTSDPTPVLKCLSLGLLLILIQAEHDDDVFTRFDQYMPNDLRVSFESLTESFYESFKHLIKSKQHEFWYKIAQYIMEYQKNFKTKILTSGFLSTHMIKMFRDLLAQKDPNFPNLFAMLVYDPDPKLFLNTLFDQLKSEQQKINFFCLSERYYALINDTEKVVKQRQCRLKYFYFAELRRQDPEQVKNRDIDLIPFNGLKNELRSKILSIDLLEKFCDDFDLNYQSVLLSQITNILEKQELEFDIKVDQFGKEELIVKTNADNIRIVCQPYIDEIENKKDLTECLINFLPKINSYFYELYLCIFEILLYLKKLSIEDTKRLKLFCSILIFLKHRMTTKRKSRPTDIETESWLKNQTDKLTLSKIAKYRLPFSFFFEGAPLDTIMKNDIDIDNCESWFPLIKFYAELSEKSADKQDHIIISTIKRAITKYCCKDFDTWQLTPVNNAFLQSVLRLLSHISDKSMILSILYGLTNNAPDGADQVEAAYECYKFARENEHELLKANKSNTNVELIAKIRRKYPMFKIQHLLHVYNLVEDKLLQLIENPKDLIIALYHHESILTIRKPNINQLVAEISELGDIKLMKLQCALLEKWLSCSGDVDVPELEETFYENLHADDTIAIEKNDQFTSEFVTRSHYILSSWEPTDAISFLLSKVFSADGTVNAGKQLQAFECFCKLLNGTNINEEYLKVMNQEQFIIIKCVYCLKQLGFNFTIDKFAKYNKLCLLKKIWQNYSDKSLAMEVIANICIGFNIHEPKIWNGVLKQMVNFNMLKELNALVEILSSKRDLLYTDGLKLAWEHVLKAPFRNANRSRSFEQEELLSKNLFRIQCCPLVDELNLVELAQDCIRLDRPHMAAILIGICNGQQKENIKKLLTPQCSKKSLKEDIIELKEFGILLNIINNVLNELGL